jgi:hypothetical protein
MVTLKEKVEEFLARHEKHFLPCMVCGKLVTRLGQAVCSNCLDATARPGCHFCGGSGTWHDQPCVCKDHGLDEAKAAREK